MQVFRIPLSLTSIQVLRNLDSYDRIAFTSKNAVRFFKEILREYKIQWPHQSRIIQVGPRADLLNVAKRGMRIVFPRSAIAPHDIVKRLRARGIIVQTVPIYTTVPVPLTVAQKKSLVDGRISHLYFKSPSGVNGLLKLLPKKERAIALTIPALCIGKTTAHAARSAGWKKVSVKDVL